MTALHERIRDLAEEARVYADPDLVVGAARRRRTSRLAASMCAAAVAAVVGGVLYLPSLGRDSRTATPAPSVVSSDLPAEVRDVYPQTVPAQPGAPQLPRDTAIGPAAFFYAPCARGAPDCWPNLVLPDGRQYAVPMTVDSGMPRDPSLSPNGRYAGWGYAADGWFDLHDLQTGAIRRFGEGHGQPHTSPWVWSPDSRWLLLAEHRDGNVRRYFLADMTGGAQELPATIDGGGNSVVGVLNGGDLLVWRANTVRGLPILAVIDPATGREVRRIAASLPNSDERLLVVGEQVVGYLVSPCSCTMTMTIFGPGDVGRPTALLKMDLGDGHISGRMDLPDSAGVAAIEPGVWFARAVLPGGIALVRSHPKGTDIEIMNSVNGERVVVSRLPYDSSVVLRSQAR